MTDSKGKSGQIVLLIFSFLPGLLLLSLPLFRPGELPLVLLLLGRFHPLVLHFPIVLIILALLFELAGRLQMLKPGGNVMLAILISAAVSAFVAIAAGFLLYASGDYSGKLMDQHFWAGSLTGAAIFITLGFFLLYRRTSKFYPVYIVCLLISNGSVAFASHLGGSITHGQDYLTEYLAMIQVSDEAVAPRAESEMLVYGDLIAPIFETKCLSCHNAMRAKGGLLMTSYENLLKGGKSGLPGISHTDSIKSEILTRILLPDSSEDHMPPEGKTPLSQDEIAVLRYWINSGAADSAKLSEARKREEIAPVIERLLPDVAKYRMKKDIADMNMKEVETELAALAEKLGVLIRRDSAAEGTLFSLAMKFPPVRFTNAQFKELAPYDMFFSKLSLVSSGINNEGLYYISHMLNLRELYIQKTVVTGNGLAFLQRMPNLEILNMSFTGVDDESAIDLLKFPKLQKVYLYRSKTSAEVAAALTKHKPGLEVLLEEGPYF